LPEIVARSFARPLGPDIAVFFGIRRYKDWATLDVAADGARPVLVVEVTSIGTRTNDVEIKPEYYHRAKVPLYVIADVLEEDEDTRHVDLIGYRYAPAGYERIAPTERGWIWLDPLRLWLGVVQDPRLGCDRLACFDGETGEQIGEYKVISQALATITAERNQAEARAQAEAERRHQAEARAQAEARRAQAESDAREHAEARVRELEEAIRRLGQGSSGERP
jgi:colicin import membrane protein